RRHGERCGARPGGSPLARGGPGAPRGHHDRREPRARVLADPGAGAADRCAQARGRRRDGEEPLRIRRRRGMIEKLIEQLLKELGQDVNREGLEKTPERVAKALRYLTSGYDKDVKQVLNEAMSVEDSDEKVIVKDIDFFSVCEHHMIPYRKKVDVLDDHHLVVVLDEHGVVQDLLDVLVVARREVAQRL